MKAKQISIRLAACCFLLLACIVATPARAHDGGDSTVAAASTQYTKSRVFVLVFGKNYRRDWETPVKMQRLDITKQELKLVALKGGFESISMNMATRDSVQMVLRTVDKSMEKLLKKWQKHTPIRAIMQDFISSSEPYAALTVPTMADALGLVHTNPVLYYVDDTAFGKYHQWFAGKVCILEERIPVRAGTTHEEMDAPFTKLQKDNHAIVQQRELLKARLLDMIFGDWDRHPGQWNWGSVDSAGMKYLYPVPVDRDMVYFNSTGAFIAYIRLWAVHYARGFKGKIRKMYQFNRKARDFDRELLNGLSAGDWENTIREVQFKLSDSIIDAAVSHLPREVYAFRGEEIKRKMKSRRDGLYPAAMKYYNHLARHVYIMASDQPDFFKVTKTNGRTEVSVYNTGAETGQGRVYYRALDRRSKRLYLVGVADNDKTELTPHAGVKIKVIKDTQHNRHKYDIRARNLKILGKSVNTLGQPGVKN